MIKLEGARAPGVLRFLRPDVAGAIKLAGAGGLLILFVLTLAFGYQQRQLARTWQKVACTQRLQESVRRTPFMAGVLLTPDSCATLEHLGLNLDIPGQLSPEGS